VAVHRFIANFSNFCAWHCDWQKPKVPALLQVHRKKIDAFRMIHAPETDTLLLQRVEEII
jgi:hypothetical protein